MPLRWRILAAIVAGVIAMLVLYQHEKEMQQRAFGGQRIRVLVSKGDMRPGARVQEDSVTTQEIPEIYLHPQSIRESDAGQVLGRPLSVAIKQGQPIQWTDFGSAGRDKAGGVVPKGLRGVAIPVSEYLGKSSLVAAGDRIDVLATLGNSSEIKGSITVTLLQNVLLIDINGATAVLALELEEAELVTFAATHGNVSLLLRNAEDLDIKKDIPPKSLKSLTARIAVLEQISISSTNAPPQGATFDPKRLGKNR